jgi:hypothetical protein
MFQPGKSGNPSGRPPRSRNFATLIFDQLNEKVLFNGRKVTRFELMLRGQVDAAVAGDPKSVREIAKLWLSYHSDCPDGVDAGVELQIAGQTHLMLDDLIKRDIAEKRKRDAKAAKSARLKKARAERARNKRAADKKAKAEGERWAKFRAALDEEKAALARNTKPPTPPPEKGNSAKPQ